MCITVFDIVVEGGTYDTKDLTVNTGKSQSRGDTEFKCVLLVAKILKMKRKIPLYRNTKISCNIWAAVIHQRESLNLN